MFKYITVTVEGLKGRRNIVAFVDEGASISLLDESLASELGLKGTQKTVSIRWINDKDMQVKYRRLSVDINGRDPELPTYIMKNVCDG